MVLNQQRNQLRRKIMANRKQNRIVRQDGYQTIIEGYQPRKSEEESQFNGDENAPEKLQPPTSGSAIIPKVRSKTSNKQEKNN